MRRTYEREFAISRGNLAPDDVDFGERHGLFHEDNPLRLRHLFPTESIGIEWTDSHERWRLVALTWAIEHCSGDPDALFDEVNAIWADFNKPADMTQLVSFMPTSDANASVSSLMEKIRDYVALKQSELSGAGT